MNEPKREYLLGRRIGLLGAGNMAEALVRGVLASGAVPATDMLASDLAEPRRAVFAALGIKTTIDNLEVVSNSDIIVLCTKPQQADEVVRAITAGFRPDRQILASICAGVSTARLAHNLPEGARVVRVMPNTPMLIGLGASAVAGGRHAREEDIAAVEALFATASLTVRVEEEKIDAVTGLSGSGPAYLFYLVEAMIEGGIAAGLTPEQSKILATRTAYGAAKMLEQTGRPAEDLRRQVTSPNGTTQAAVELLEARQAHAIISAAVQRAAQRSRELGEAPPPH